MYRLIFFDIDGTLIRTGGAGEKAFSKVIQSQFDIHNGTEELEFAGRTDYSIIREFFTQKGINPSSDNFERFLDHYVFWLDHLLKENPGQVLPGVIPLLNTLQQLKSPPTLGLLTGNIQLGAEIKLSFYELWEYFTTGGFADDGEDRNEVATAAFNRGNRITSPKVKPSEVLVIGDTPRDITCAQFIDADVLAVATGKFTVDELKEHQPTHVAETLESVDPGIFSSNGK